MAVRITLSDPTPSALPADGWLVGYRILGSGDPYTTVGPFTTMPIEIDTTDPVGTLYEGYIDRDCGILVSTHFFWQTPCNCTEAGYVLATGGDQCQLNETLPPTVTGSGFCLATSQNAVYTSFGSRIYEPGFLTSTLNINFGTPDALIYSDLTLAGQWRNSLSQLTVGPLNREGVWIDTDCDGNKDALANGTRTTIAYTFNNLGGARTIYLGVAADNQFQVVVNGVQVADSGVSGDKQFKIWHIIPVDIVPGLNYFNWIGTGDGSVNDAIGGAIYDNTKTEILAASSDLDLVIPFHTSTLRGTTYNVVTCASGYSLDVSGGSGAYICRRTSYLPCNTLPIAP